MAELKEKIPLSGDLQYNVNTTHLKPSLKLGETGDLKHLAASISHVTLVIFVCEGTDRF